MKTVRVFLSHSAKDRRHVERIARFLEQNRVEFFYSKRHIRGAREWHDELGTALDTCNRFVLLLSPDAVKSRWVKHELVYALQERAYQNRIFPLVLKACNAKKLSWTLQSFQQIDLRRRFDAACQELLRALR